MASIWFRVLQPSVVAAVLISLAGCGLISSEFQYVSGRAVGPLLEQKTAELRAQQVSDPSYQLHMQLNARGEPYQGRVVIEFDYLPAGEPLTLDFNGGEVLDFQINGQPARFGYNGFFLEIPQNQLTAGPTRFEIGFSHPYSDNSRGLYYFRDPVDDTSYVYTDFEPFQANRAFPLFDQPDLKATFELQVTAPASWVVVANEMPTQVEDMGDNKHWSFPPTAKISSYVFALHAGDYWQHELAPYGDLRMRLLARQSVQERVAVQTWDEMTRAGFDYLAEYFDLDYPFNKFDQLGVPNFSWGGMENVGAVTFHEVYCCAPGEQTLDQKTFFVNVILHEQAHMWFGNLVTMRWWDDLWLNESFAELAAYKAMVEGIGMEDAWLNFLWRRKTWGYRDDDYPSTHPIVAAAPDTQVAISLIDGITYAKGGATLRQLQFFVGEENFRDAIRQYMRDHAWGNTRLQDLLDAMANQSGLDVNSWADDWLRSVGTNRVSAQVQCEQGRVSDLSLVQSLGPTGDRLRQHRLQVALYPTLDSEPRVEPVLVSGETTALPQFIGEPCPAVVLPNYGDWGFVKINLDETSLHNLEQGLTRIGDPLSRALLWLALKDGVTDGAYSPLFYSQTAISQLASETNSHNIAGVLDYLSELEHWYRLMPLDPVTSARLDQVHDELGLLMLDQLAKVEPGGDDFLSWWDAYLLHARQPAQLEVLQRWLSEGTAAGWTIDQPRRWNLLLVLAKSGVDVRNHLEAERERDGSSDGRLSYLEAMAALPDQRQRFAELERIIQGEDSLQSYAEREAVISGSIRSRLPGAMLSEAPAYLELVVQHAADAGDIEREFARWLPNTFSCSAEWEPLVNFWKRKIPDLPHSVSNGLEESIFNNRNCMQAKGALQAM